MAGRAIGNYAERLDANELYSEVGLNVAKVDIDMSPYQSRYGYRVRSGRRPSYLPMLTLACSFMIPQILLAQDSTDRRPVESVPYFSAFPTHSTNPTYDTSRHAAFGGYSKDTVPSSANKPVKKFFLFEKRNMIKFGLLEFATLGDIETGHICEEQHLGYETNPALSPFSESRLATHAALAGINLLLTALSNRLEKSDNRLLKWVAEAIVPVAAGSHAFATWRNVYECKK